MRLIDLTGKPFGRLTVRQRAENIGRRVAWLCDCRCGKTVTIVGHRLVSGDTQSCGCRLREARWKHGLSKTTAYKVWHSMIARCEDPEHEAYADYGGRGITVCERWHDVRLFIEDMGQPPKGATLDRRDNDKGYDKDNCRWATWNDQNRNHRANHIVSFKGRMMTVAEWMEETGLPIRDRLRQGWTIERALTQPKQIRRS